ncbi:nucleoplasmin-2-like [Suncus etruscus]|uniref:nucleoplasmin-2-like n=1 Tax=Suncus etruscus TaxID=109475 RepID=UPI00210F2D1E|nr:nucleoplasmin-2-like [Suncus etruscus]
MLCRVPSLVPSLALCLAVGSELNQGQADLDLLKPVLGEAGLQLLLSMICLREKAKMEMNLVDIVLAASRENWKTKPITNASPSAPPCCHVVLPGAGALSPFTCGLALDPCSLSDLEHYDFKDRSWQEEKQEEEEVEKEEDDEEDCDSYVSLEDSTSQTQSKGQATQKADNYGKVGKDEQ